MVDLDNISDTNPIKLVFKIAKELLNIGVSQQKIFDSKVILANELDTFKNLNIEQTKALVDFLEYLFLIDDKTLDEKYKDFKKQKGGILGMGIDEIREAYYVNKGIEAGIENKAIKIAEKNVKKRRLHRRNS